MAIHPLKTEKEFKEELKDREIRYTWHFEQERLPDRSNVTKDLIEEHLQNPSALLEFKHVEDDHNREKYETLFDKSSKYYLKIVLSMSSGEIYIVTAHVINKTRKDLAQSLG